VVPGGARLRQLVPVRVRGAGQRAEHRRADAQGPGGLAHQPDTLQPGRCRPGLDGRVHAVHVLHVPVHRQEGGVLARGRRLRAVPHVRVPGAAHHVHSAHAHFGHVAIRRRQVSAHGCAPLHVRYHFIVIIDLEVIVTQDRIIKYNIIANNNKNIY